MIVTPTLHFNGKCEEAIKLYQKAFDLKVDNLLYCKDADKRDLEDEELSEDGELIEERSNQIMHSEVLIGNHRLRMSDGSDQLFLTISFDTADEVKKSFDILLEAGSTIVEPLQTTTYSSCMGSIIDKYGFRWRLMTDQTER